MMLGVGVSPRSTREIGRSRGSGDTIRETVSL